MSELVWVENTKPDRPGIWAFKYENGEAAIREVTEGNLSHWDFGTWCFICDLPNIKDPPKYRGVTEVDAQSQREVLVRSAADYEFPATLLAFSVTKNRVVVEDKRGHIFYYPVECARILDDAPQVSKKPREWMLGVDGQNYIQQQWYGRNREHAGANVMRGCRLVRVREVLDAQ